MATTNVSLFGKSLENSTSIQSTSSHVSSEVIAVIVFSTIMCVLGFFSNIMVIIVNLRRRTSQHPSNWFIFNLAVSDLAIVVVIMPYNLINPFVNWPFGDIGCKYLVMPIMEHFASVCVLTHTAISLARYIIINNTGKTIINLNLVRVTICIIWICSFLVLSATLMGPLGKFELFYSVGSDRKLSCGLKWISDAKRKTYRICVFILTYCIPVVITGYSYSKTREIVTKNLNEVGQHLPSSMLMSRRRNNRRMVSMLITMYSMFCLTTLPIQLFCFLYDFDLIPKHYSSKLIFDILLILFYAQVITNPSVLFYMGKEYRKEFYRMCSMCSPPRVPDTQEDSIKYRKGKQRVIRRSRVSRKHNGSMVSNKTIVSTYGIPNTKEDNRKSNRSSILSKMQNITSSFRPGLTLYSYDSKIGYVDLANEYGRETFI